MKASNAISASALVSAIQISCNDRLAFGCWLFGSLLRTLAALCTQQRCSWQVGQTSPSAFQNPSAIGHRDLGCDGETSVLQVDQQFAPVLRALAGAVVEAELRSDGEADQLLPAFRSGADEHENALLLVLQPGLQMDAI